MKRGNTLLYANYIKDAEETDEVQGAGVFQHTTGNSHE